MASDRNDGGHTPTPWSWHRRKGDSGNFVYIESLTGTIVLAAEEYAGSAWIEIENAADADFILDAVNSYATSQAEISRLREALADLEKSATVVAKYGAQTGSWWMALTGSLIKARAALSEAK